ncbi:ABC transporter permease [Brevibacillus fulvus]|uniref:ABC-2 type transport system permease protein n=1 Tax=Brevibacillus fulvus TaxID=1125967 RepID=A0A938Y0E4_9BACL|nr:ABC transporter permease [Brevibacillus fulvus]MBM7591609.1 ABC-2 type transport system permease protein [Brevibacillus fulvus]
MFEKWRNRNDAKVFHPFWVIVQKEVADHVHSWRFLILVGLLMLTCIGSLYTAMTTIRTAVPQDDSLNSFLFLKLFTVSDGTLPPFITFIGFLGPLLGIGMGFDAINAERNKGTLSRLISQPIYRDYVLNAKFTAALLVISVLLFGLGLLVMGLGLLAIGIPPSPEEFWRMIFFLLLSIVYIAFWLNLSILCSVRFKQAATSALSSIAVWIFFSVFFSLIIRLVANIAAPTEVATEETAVAYQQFIQNLSRLSPSQLFSDATTTMLTPSVRSLGPLTMEQIYGAIPSPLPLGQSLLLVWPQVTGLLAATLLCFALSYYLFMRQEIRSRS